MRPAALLLLVLFLIVAGCGESDERPASPEDPETPVQAPAQTAPPAANPPDPAACERLAERLSGKPLDRAEKMARKQRCDLRVISRDGTPLAVTDDFNPARINVQVRDGDVSEVAGLY